MLNNLFIGEINASLFLNELLSDEIKSIFNALKQFENHQIVILKNIDSNSVQELEEKLEYKRNSEIMFIQLMSQNENGEIYPTDDDIPIYISFFTEHFTLFVDLLYIEHMKKMLQRLLMDFKLMVHSRNEETILNLIVDTSNLWFISAKYLNTKIQNQKLKKYLKRINMLDKSFQTVLHSLMIFSMCNNLLKKDKNRLEGLLISNQEAFQTFQKDDFIDLGYLFGTSFFDVHSFLHKGTFTLFSGYILKKSIDCYNREIEFHKNIQAKNSLITSCLGYVSDKKIILYEFMCNGYLDYENNMKNIPKTGTEKSITILRTLCAIDFFHSNGYIFRNLKPDKIFFDYYKQSSLGSLSSITKVSLLNKTTEENILSSTYSSPEQIASSYAQNPKSWNYKMDIYSFGLLSYYIINQKNPLSSFSLSEIDKIKLDPSNKIVINLGINNVFNGIFQQCIQYNPSARPSALFLLIKIFANNIFLKNCNEFILNEFKSNYMGYRSKLDIEAVNLNEWLIELKNDSKSEFKIKIDKLQSLEIKNIYISILEGIYQNDDYIINQFNIFSKNSSSQDLGNEELLNKFILSFLDFILT